MLQVVSSGANSCNQPNSLRLVSEFHKLFRQPILDSPCIPKENRGALRVSLLREEIQELKDAIDQCNLVEVADAFADIQYVLSGAILEFGMKDNFKDLFIEVHRSNMSKACKSYDEAEETRKHYIERKGHDSTIEEKIIDDDKMWLVYRAGDKKALKSIRYSPANLSPILFDGNNEMITTNMSTGTKAVAAINAAKNKDDTDPDALNSVAEFHQLFSCPVLSNPTIPSKERSSLRVSLLEEELNELEDAIRENDIVEVADALTDIQYVLSGAILEFGMGSIFEKLFNEVHRSNMSKACLNREEAELTRKHYIKTKGHDSNIEKIVLTRDYDVGDDNTTANEQKVNYEDDKWLVFRCGDGKVLKSITYSPANLLPFLPCN